MTPLSLRRVLNHESKHVRMLKSDTTTVGTISDVAEPATMIVGISKLLKGGHSSMRGILGMPGAPGNVGKGGRVVMVRKS